MKTSYQDIKEILIILVEEGVFNKKIIERLNEDYKRGDSGVKGFLRNFYAGVFYNIKNYR